MYFDGNSMLLQSKKHGSVRTQIGFVKYEDVTDGTILTDELVIIEHTETEEKICIYLGDFYDCDFRIFSSLDNYVQNLLNNDPDIKILEYGISLN